MRQNTILEVLSQKDASQNSIPEPLFSSINITNASLSPTKFWVATFFIKIALTIRKVQENKEAEWDTASDLY
jgi:hypothetical protein